MRDLGVWRGGGGADEGVPPREKWRNSLATGEWRTKTGATTPPPLHSSPTPSTIHPGAAVKEPDDRNWKRKTGGGAEHVGICWKLFLY